MSKPRFTVKEIKTKYITLYALKMQGKTIAQIELKGSKIRIYPLIKAIRFIEKGAIK